MEVGLATIFPAKRKVIPHRSDSLLSFPDANHFQQGTTEIPKERQRFFPTPQWMMISENTTRHDELTKTWTRHFLIVDVGNVDANSGNNSRPNHPRHRYPSHVDSIHDQSQSSGVSLNHSTVPTRSPRSDRNFWDFSDPEGGLTHL